MATILPPVCSVVSNLDQPPGGSYRNIYNVAVDGSAIPTTNFHGAAIRTGPIPTRLIAATFRVVAFPDPGCGCGYSLFISQLADAMLANQLPFSVPAPDYSSAVFSVTSVSAYYDAPTTIRYVHCVEWCVKVSSSCHHDRVISCISCRLDLTASGAGFDFAPNTAYMLHAAPAAGCSFGEVTAICQTCTTTTAQGFSVVGSAYGSFDTEFFFQHSADLPSPFIALEIADARCAWTVCL